MQTKPERIGLRDESPAIHIRWCICRDLPKVLDIERWSFEFPWSEDDFVRCLRGRNAICQVAERDERIVGFVVYELHKTRLEILNLAVDPLARREGVGTAILNKLKGKLSAQRRTRIFADVRESNLEAQRFFRESGFVAAEIVRDPFDCCDEDAYRFVFRREWR
jgi:ribosomal-protein-alanine N-acetyltransferase